MQNEKKVAAAVVGIIFLGVVADLGFWGFVIWAIYKLVVHFTK